MKVLVTGANGFVGSHLCRQLAKDGATVRALVRKGSDRRVLNGTAVDVVEGDILNPGSLDQAVEGCEHVFHTAALVRFFVPDKAAMRQTNVQGTRNILESAKKAGVKRFVHTSTVAVLKRFGDGTVSDESMIANASQVIGEYELTKLEAERLALAAAADGLPVVVCNAAGPAGPGDIKPSPMGRVIVEFLRRKIPVYTATGLNVVDVRDVAQGHILAAEKGRVGQRYILGGENITLESFFGLLSKISGVPAPTIRVPYALALVGGVLGEISGRITRKEPLACLASVRMSRHPHYFTSEKAKRELGYSPRPIRESLAEEVAWFLEQGMV